jgi:hypothetical protein
MGKGNGFFNLNSSGQRAYDKPPRSLSIGSNAEDTAASPHLQCGWLAISILG